jgi:membrane-associated PAP2 superfamily phosphatase
MKYSFIALFCLPMALIAQNNSHQTDTLSKNKRHYLVKDDGSKYLFSHEQWLKMTQEERASMVSISDIQEALKRIGYYHGAINGKVNEHFKKAITKFSLDTGLPVFPHGRIIYYEAWGLLD